MAVLDLTKKSGKTGRSFFSIIQDVKKQDLDPDKRRDTLSKMSYDTITVHCKSQKNKSILLSDNTIICFDDNGIGKVPAHARAALELEMMHKPGRVSIVVDQTMVVEEVVPQEPVLETEKELLAALSKVDETTEEEEVIEESKPTAKRGRPKK